MRLGRNPFLFAMKGLALSNKLRYASRVPLATSNAEPFAMEPKNSESRFSPLVIALHWLTVLLLIAVYASVELRGLAPKGSELRGNIKSLHFLLGLSVLVVVVIRIWVRIQTGQTPRIEPPMHKWQALAAGAMHHAPCTLCFHDRPPPNRMANLERIWKAYCSIWTSNPLPNRHRYRIFAPAQGGA